MKFRVTILTCCFILLNCAKEPTDKVVVIEKTSSYHREECAKVKMARTSYASREEFLKKGYTACPYCKPDSK